MATPDEVRAVWTFLAACFPMFGSDDDTVNDLALSAYQIMLADLTPDQLRAAAIRHVAISRFFPTVAELREQVQAGETQHPDAAEAWRLVRDAMLSGETSPNHTPQFGDSLVQGTVEALGWRDLCLGENTGLDRAHFINAYERLRVRDAQAAALPALLTSSRRLGLLGDDQHRLEGGQRAKG